MFLHFNHLIGIDHATRYKVEITYFVNVFLIFLVLLLNHQADHQLFKSNQMCGAVFKLLKYLKISLSIIIVYYVLVIPSEQTETYRWHYYKVTHMFGR